jgi:hypothetical protein
VGYLCPTRCSHKDVDENPHFILQRQQLRIKLTKASNALLNITFINRGRRSGRDVGKYSRAIEMSSVMSNVGYKGLQRETLTQQVKVTEDYSSATPETATHSKTTSDPIVIIDIHLFSRECFARVLSKDCQVPVAGFSTIDEWWRRARQCPPR